jgi:hypothetical protein
MHAHQTPQKVLVHLDSRTVAMEVGIGVEVREEALAVMLGETASSADLGGSSKYSSENLED